MNEKTGPAVELPLFYKAVIPLDSRRHARIRLKHPRNYGYAGGAAAVPVLAEEFARLCGHFPIVFRTGDTPLPLALVGLRENENLFVDSSGAWDTQAPVPLYVERYPFILMETAELGNYALGFDEGSELLGSEGIPLFEEGKQTPALTEILRLCTSMKAQADQTEYFAAALQAMDLLVERRAQISVGSNNNVSLSGFSVVDEDRFMKLPDQVWLEWKQSGWVGLIYAHFFSLGRIANLSATAGARLAAT